MFKKINLHYYLVKKRTIYFIILLFYLADIQSFGQQNIDSLYSLLQTSRNDTLKIKLRAEIGEIGPILRTGYWDSIRIDAEKWGMMKYVAQAINNMGYIYDNLSDISKALAFYTDGLKIRQEIGDRHGIAESLNNIAIIFEKQGDIPHALEYHFRALKVQEEIDDKPGIALSLNNIAYIYNWQDDISEALKYYEKSLLICKDLNDKSMIATDLNNIGLVYRTLAYKVSKSETQRYDSLLDKSMEYLNDALRIFTEIEDNESIATMFQNIGMIYQDKNDHPSAKLYFDKSLVMCEKLQNKRGLTFILNSIGGIYLDEGNYPEALHYGLRALALGKELGYPKDISISARMLSDVYQSQNRWFDAFKMQQLYYSMRDSINNETTRKASMQKQFQYEYDKKESLLKAEQEKERAVSAEKSRKQKILIWAIISGLLTVIVFSGFVYRSLRLTRAQKKLIEIKNRETEVQKKIIEEKNKDITDSILYAKRIQQAKLPDKQIIYSCLAQCFLLFKPKDIVSGDFYFFHKNNSSYFIAAADCTGHGVPGALMSMIGSEKLDEAISLSSDTSQILKQLNIGVKNSLHQSDTRESTRDGMDIALCSIDPESLILKFAGANRPVWIIRKGQTEIEEIQGTKQAIGGLTDDNQHFDTHEIKLEHGDAFYIFSDGYADTFSGSTGKKLKTKRFKEILVEIQEKKMPEQEQYLNDFIDEWKSGIDQVDDILVIGVRV